MSPPVFDIQDRLFTSPPYGPSPLQNYRSPGTRTGRLSAKDPNLSNVPRSVPVLAPGDLVRHRYKDAEHGLGKVLLVSKQTRLRSTRKVLIEWEHKIDSARDTLLWITEGEDLVLPNIYGRHGIHYPSDLKKIDLITAIGTLSAG